ncbi:UNVERIFIED_CONTAM: hypothetical protein Slati_4160000 [Sesamum latifolium]|uniref:Reverse transcriptase zinc-binding domain-containing protein n=1 Tax=Sesamum latifolium TaxID=2727402 RepID=A0AAW2T8T3_9LAMI
MTFSLWRDPWHELGLLVHLFPRGSNLTRTDVTAPLASVIINGQWVWPVQGYRRNSIEFLQILHSLLTIHGGVDRVEWKHNGGTFSTASVYDHFRTPGPKIGWSSLLSGVFKIPRDSFILWLAILGKLSTLDKPWLSHLGRDCILCVNGLPETHDHLFFECTYARQCLASIRRQTRFPWPYRDWRRNILWASGMERETYSAFGLKGSIGFDHIPHLAGTKQEALSRGGTRSIHIRLTSCRGY